MQTGAVGRGPGGLGCALQLAEQRVGGKERTADSAERDSCLHSSHQLSCGQAEMVLCFSCV